MTHTLFWLPAYLQPKTTYLTYCQAARILLARRYWSKQNFDPTAEMEFAVHPTRPPSRIIKTPRY
jgi:hypothetical protein